MDRSKNRDGEKEGWKERQRLIETDLQKKKTEKRKMHGRTEGEQDI